MSKLITFILLFFCSSLFAAEQLIIEPDAGREPLLQAINQAKSSINLVMYGFTDTVLMNAMINAEKTGKQVNILLEPHPYKADDENNNAIQILQTAKVPLQFANPEFKLTHQKTFIIDHRSAIIMTFNLTHSSFKKERNFALITDDPSITQEIEKVFKADWQHRTISASNPNLIWSPDNAQEKILSFINSATSRIDIYAQDISDYKTIGTLAKAAKKGKKVRILLSRFQENKPSKKFDFLRKSGVEISFCKNLYIHAKVIIIDHKRAMLGSTNFTYPSMKNNRELSVITRNPEVISQLLNTFEKDWDGYQTTIPAKSFPLPKQEMKHLIHAYEKFFSRLLRQLY